MVETATARSFVERVKEDVSQKAEKLRSDEVEALSRAQEQWDRGKELADKFSLKVKLEQVKKILQYVPDKSPVELVESKRPEDYGSLTSYNLMLSWHSNYRIANRFYVLVEVSDGKISVFSDHIQHCGRKDLVADALTEQQVDDALFEAYQHPRASR